MPTILATNAAEESTFIIAVSFEDEDGNDVTPNDGLTWTLTDVNGTVINEREDVALVEDTTVYIVLSGADLALSGGDVSGTRIVTVQGTYDSATHGNDLPLKDQVQFNIINLKIIT